MPKARPKQQHYVTKAYLDGFVAADNNQLLCYGRTGKTFARRTQDLATQRNFYAFKNDEGEWDDSLEDFIERHVEGPGLPVLKKLIKGNTRLNWDERTALARFVAFQEVRTPESHRSTLEFTRAMTDTILLDIRAADPTQRTVGITGLNGKKSTVTLAEIEESQAESEREHSFQRLKLCMSPAMDLYRFYERMKFTIYYAAKNNMFITTDNPVVRVYQREGRGSGLVRGDVEVRFPISSGALLTITHDVAFERQLSKLVGAEKVKLLKRLPEIRVKYASEADVLSLIEGT